MSKFTYVSQKGKAERFVKSVEGKNPVFTCVIATTDVAKIPDISAAGKNPELCDYTPPADIELLFHGKCKCINGIPVTPDGIPTPAIITVTALKLANIPLFAVSGGLKVKPQTPFIELGGKPGIDIRTGRAVKNPEKVLRKAIIAGENLAKTSDYLVIGESIPGGTTTCLGLMYVMGYNVEGKVSSSMSENPHNLKIKIVKEGLKKSGISFGDLRDDPFKAISLIGDPMMPAFSGLILGAARKKPVLLAGGTQMTSILAIVKKLRPELLENIAIGTTSWILKDRTSDLKGLVNQIADIPIIAANLDFSNSKYQGLRTYDLGVVKEGVGAGGVAVASMLKLKRKITWNRLSEEIEKNYKRLIEVGEI